MKPTLPKLGRKHSSVFLNVCVDCSCVISISLLERIKSTLESELFTGDTSTRQSFARTDNPSSESGLRAPIQAEYIIHDVIKREAEVDTMSCCQLTKRVKRVKYSKFICLYFVAKDI